jgi:DNA excision repair protein ERCC-4
MLLTYDAIAFQQYLEGLLESNTVSISGKVRQHQSPWLLTDAANVIFQYAKRRCYVLNKTPEKEVEVINVDDDDAWEALREAEGGTSHMASRTTPVRKGQASLPIGLEPVLEELPKWSLVASALQEIEEEIIHREAKLTSRRYLLIPFILGYAHIFQVIRVKTLSLS